MSARPTDVLFDVELSDHADMEHEAQVDALIEKVERALALRSFINVARIHITQHGDDIRRLEAEIGSAQAELAELMGVDRA